jgi:8-oxo-dGTP diphosphatase
MKTDLDNKISLQGYKETLKEPLKPTTVTFLIRGDEVLLGMKMRGLGEGYIVGIGGKVDVKDRNNSDQVELDVVKAAAAREITEEIGVDVDPNNLVLRGSMEYYFPHKNGKWNFVSHVLVTDTWKREPTGVIDSNGVVEIEPIWIKLSEIPYEKMWDDAKFWLPQVLAGKSIKGEFLFDKDLKVRDYLVKENN